MRPLLQVALDVTDGEKALSLAQEVKDFVDILEAGTPLIKAKGIEIVSKLKKLAPEKKVTADMKTADIGAVEAGIAFRAGADIVTVLACAYPSTIEAAILEARIHEKQVMVDMVGTIKKSTKVRQLKGLKPDYFCVHTGIDEQLKGKTPFQDLKEIATIKNVTLAVAGGIKLENLDQLADFQPAIIIVGAGITKKNNPREAAKAIKEEIDRLWPD